MPQSDPIARTRRWLERIVIGLNLCPFARHPYANEKIKFVLEPSNSDQIIMQTLLLELDSLYQSDDFQTTLIICPNAFDDFDAFWHFIADCEALVEQAGLEGTFQLASFHPRYRFEDTKTGDLGNATNQSPYPTLHILREADVTAAVSAYGDTDVISQRNIATLEKLGKLPNFDA
jgi:uncharacterized protein